MEFGLASVSDAEAVTDLWVDLAAEQTQYGSHVCPEDNRGVIRDELTRHAVTDRLVIAREEGIVGFVMFTVDRGSYEMGVTQGIVENLYVVPDRRDEGVGSELLGRAERRLDALGAETVVLEAMADNDAARRFYRRHGYGTYRVQLEKPLDETEGQTRDGAD
jgi:ribosomal protein S18 acetylase RimI-like enzyme